ncbi:HD domain-containing protein [Candidatus Pacearchaeota archaeon]|nr:HD domain-containing protein [Candidatus Pacearchaeota archaeon]
MIKEDVISMTKVYVRKTLEGEGSGHDWQHIQRVYAMAVKIGKEEKADLFIVELGALLHDIADWKFTMGDESVAPRLAREWLSTCRVDESTIDRVTAIIKEISFKGAGVATPMSSLEGQVVQDGDRLDALGAIGIARCFAYGGYKGREIHNPEIVPTSHTSFEQYKASKGTGINHFYEKLLLLKDRMNTETGKKMALERHQFMEKYLDQFHAEYRAER